MKIACHKAIIGGISPWDEGEVFKIQFSRKSAQGVMPGENLF
jgi:hypothetical protein